MNQKLRVVSATRLSPELYQLITGADSRIELVVQQELLPPMRHPADFAGDPRYKRSAEQQATFEKLLDSADALYGIPDVDPASLARTVRANPGLRWVHTMAAGGGAQVRAAGLDTAELNRVIFTTSAGVHAESLAEFAVFGVLAGAKNLPRLLEQQKNRQWGSQRWMMSQISEQTVLILGLGGIGKAIAEKLLALGMKVIGTSRGKQPENERAQVIHPQNIARVLPEVSAVVTTLPDTASTHHLIDAEFFAQLKAGAVLVNVGRGSVVDENALLTALDEEIVSFAALDVFEIEPLPEDSPLWSHPRVLISPHTAALTEKEEYRIAKLFSENASRLLDGQPLRNVLNTVEFY